jgi:hypothetical protein
MPDSATSNVAERLARIEVGMANIHHLLAPLAGIGETMARIQERSAAHDNHIDGLLNKHERSEQRVAAVDAEVRKWVNRGVGAYTVAGVLVAAIASLIFRTVTEYESAIKTNRESIVNLDKRLTQMEFKAQHEARP